MLVKCYKCEVCAFVCSRKTVGELVEDMEEVRCTDDAFGNREMTFKLNKASTFCFLRTTIFGTVGTEEAERIFFVLWKEVVREDCQARKLNKEDAMDRCKWRKMIKEAR